MPGGLPVARSGFIRIFGHFRVLRTMFPTGIGGLPVSWRTSCHRVEVSGGIGGLPGPWRTSGHR